MSQVNSEVGLIGHVTAVASNELRIRLNDSSSGLSKIGTDGVTTVGVVNSYVVVPAGPHRIVAIVTGVRISGDDRNNTATLDDSRCDLDATITGRFEDETFKSGLVGYPSLNAPVYCASTNEIRRIFVPGTRPALRLGESSVVSEQDVYLDANLLLAHHCVVVGSTGSGKSCTVTAILDGLLELDVPSGHAIIFDINGEYAQCFKEGTSRASITRTVVLGPVPGTDTALILPHWFLNNEETLTLFRASEGAQAPILQRAIADARIGEEAPNSPVLTLRVIGDTMTLLETLAADRNPQKNLGSQLQSLDAFLEPLAKSHDDSLASHYDRMRTKCNQAKNLLKLTGADWTPLTTEQRSIVGHLAQKIRDIVREAYNAAGLGSSNAAMDFDAPIYFDLQKLCDFYLPQRVQLEQQQDPRIGNYVSTLLMRLSRLLADGRYNFMTRVPRHSDVLATYLRAVLCADPFRDAPDASDWPAKDAYQRQLSESSTGMSVTIFDLSLVASDVLENVTALLGRLLFEFAVRSNPRASHPMVLILEEAHRFVPSDRSGVGSRSAAVFERIAKEGRKFGVSLLLASQRPSELAETVVAQCGTVIAHRLTHEADQALLRHATSLVSHGLLSQLPGLAQQHALVTGVATSVPAAVKIRDVTDPPRSNDPDFISIWRNPEVVTSLGEHIDKTARTWESGNANP